MAKKEYFTHENGGRPFRIEIDGMKVSVYKNMDTFEEVNGKYKDISMPEKHMFDVTADEIFIGKKSPKGDYNGLKPKEAEGNSILLLSGSKYIYIGYEIYEFTPVKGDTIEKYYSDIGNNDVPYPYAVGKTHIYIMLDKVAVEKSFFNMKNGIYEQYYEGTTYLKHRLSKMAKEEKKNARERMDELVEKTTKLKKKMLEKRN